MLKVNDNHHCHNKPSDRKWEYGWRHVRKRWSWEFEDFEKESVESWHWTVEADSWVSAIGVWSRVVGDSAIESKSWVFRISTRRDKLRSKTPQDVPNVGGGINIVWLRKTFKNCVSLSPRVEESKQEINKPPLPEQQSLPVFVFACFRLSFVFAFLYVPLDWYHYGYE